MTSETQNKNPDESQAETASEHFREAFDAAKEAAYATLTGAAQETEDEVELADKAIAAFLASLETTGDTDIGRAAALLKAELAKVNTP